MAQSTGPIALALFAAACGAPSAPMEGRAALETTQCPANNICYGGGKVLKSPPIYVIWYGTAWDPVEQAIVANYLQSVSGSSYLKILPLYYDSAGPATSSIHYDTRQRTSPYVDNYSLGKLLGVDTPGDFGRIAQRAVASGAFPSDPNALYLIFADDNVNYNGGLGDLCAWHSVTFVSPLLHFAALPHPAKSGCVGHGPSPNNDAYGDALVGSLSHEMVEAITDPDVNGWFDATVVAGEVADKCQGLYDPEYAAPNGASANLHLSGGDFLVPQYWVPQHGGYCALAIDPRPRAGLLAHLAGSGQIATSDGRFCDGVCDWSLLAGTHLTLTASVAAGSTATWSGCDSSSGNSCSITVSSDRAVTATVVSCTPDPACYQECLADCVGSKASCQSRCKAACASC